MPYLQYLWTYTIQSLGTFAIQYMLLPNLNVYMGYTYNLYVN